MSNRTYQILIAVLLCLIVVIKYLDYYDHQNNLDKIKELEVEIDWLHNINDSLGNDNYTLLINVVEREKKIDSLKKKSVIYTDIINRYKDKLNEKDHEYFNRANDSIVMSIFDGTNIAPNTNR